MDANLVDEFVGELKEHIAKIEEGILNLDKNLNDPDDEVVTQLFRQLHSTKGASGFLGLVKIEKLVHSMETLLSLVRDKKIQTDSIIVDLLFIGLDLLERMAVDINNSNEMEIDQICLQLESAGVSLPGKTRKEAAALSSESFGAVSHADASFPNQQITPQSIGEQNNLQTEGANFESADGDPTGSEQELLSDTVRIHVGVLDKLLALAGELVLVRNRHVRAVSNTDPVLQRISQRLDHVTSELQETIMQTRLQPIDNLFSRLPRIVRDISKKQGKLIDLQVVGREVELDKTVLELLADPLIHLLRNSCDHGIETPRERTAIGKSPSGTISIHTFHEAGHIHLEFKDDGRGISADSIKKKLVNSGRLSRKEINKMGYQDLLARVFMPGFSTSLEITEFSGRGVGMDVVKSSIEQVGGSIDLESYNNQGTIITIQLPLTLAIIPCLIVVVKGTRFAVPQVNIEELVCLYGAEVWENIECVGNQEVYRLRNELLPIVRFHEVLDRPQQLNNEDKMVITDKYIDQRKKATQGELTLDESLTFLVAKAGKKKFGLVVDEVIGSEEIVIKPMHRALKHIQIYSGATVMGDGRMAFILDIEGVGHHASVELSKQKESFESIAELDKQSVLLFGNGPNEHFAFPTMQVKKVNKILVSKIEQIGGNEFITLGDATLLIIRPDQIMGLTPVNEQDAPEMYLLTPRLYGDMYGVLIPKHEGIMEIPEEIKDKQYIHAACLGTVFLKGRMTVILNLYGLLQAAQPKWFEKNMPRESGDHEKKILLVDEFSFFHCLVSNYLAGRQVKVVSAYSEKEAAERLEKEDFTAILVDLERATLNGHNLLKFIKNSPAKYAAPVVAMENSQDDFEEEDLQRIGYDFCLSKYNNSELLKTIEIICDPEEERNP